MMKWLYSIGEWTFDPRVYFIWNLWMKVNILVMKVWIFYLIVVGIIGVIEANSNNYYTKVFEKLILFAFGWCGLFILVLWIGSLVY